MFFTNAVNVTVSPTTGFVGESINVSTKRSMHPLLNPQDKSGPGPLNVEPKIKKAMIIVRITNPMAVRTLVVTLSPRFIWRGLLGRPRKKGAPGRQISYLDKELLERSYYAVIVTRESFKPAERELTTQKRSDLNEERIEMVRNMAKILLGPQELEITIRNS
ncbi:MAG: hypothetical protein ACE1ZC_00340 [Nitrososphaerales archaeon]